MGLDSTTEVISHFIGIFDVKLEQVRLRDQYEEFMALRQKPEFDLLEPIEVNIEAGLDLDPGKYKPLQISAEQPLPHLLSNPVSDSRASDTDISESAAGPALIAGDIHLDQSQGRGAPVFYDARDDGRVIRVSEDEAASEFQGSVVTFTQQYVFLSDIDTFGEGNYRDSDALIASTQVSVQIAAALQLDLDPVFDLAQVSGLEGAKAIAQAMAEAESAEIPGAEIHIFRGDDVIGAFVNGEQVDALPAWGDLLPDFHRAPEDGDDEIDNRDDGPEEWARAEDPEFLEGHTVVSGGNLLINQANIVTAWVDAPYIALGGQAIDLDIVSQVAVVSDRDIGLAGADAPGTRVVQAAEIATEANRASWLPDPGVASGSPSLLTLDRIDGDYIIANFTKQMIDATDIDHITTQIGASSTYIALGDNELYNVTNIAELGLGYDLILIEGDMISIDMLFQTHVLRDDDWIVSGAGSGAMVDPEIANVKSSPTSASPVATPLDGNEEAPDMDGPAADPPSPAEDARPAEGNLVMNQATLTTIGEDQFTDLSGSMAALLSETNTEALEQALLSDPMFAGIEQLRVLKVEGDLVQINAVEQVSILSDQDDIAVTGAAEIIAGTNAMLNAANVTKVGVDSLVMTDNEAYSDLLLHQASLIDTPDAPADLDASELVNEAVAFLMDEGVDGTLSEADNEAAGLTPSVMGDVASTDVMQGMLA